MDGISWHSVTKWGRNWCGLPDYSVLVPFIGDFRNISATFAKTAAHKINKKRATPRAARLSNPNNDQPLPTLNTHLIINKDRLHGFSLPLLLLLHSQLMNLGHIWIDPLHGLELFLFPYLPFLSFSFEDLPSHDDHTLHRLV